jgi:hypothetical protein
MNRSGTRGICGIQPGGLLLLKIESLVMVFAQDASFVADLV